MTPRPVLRCLALASLRRWPGVRWFVWVPDDQRRWWIVSTRQAPMVDFVGTTACPNLYNPQAPARRGEE